MTDLEIMQILTSDLDIFEKGKAFRKALNAAKPSALAIQPKQERKKREAKAVKVTTGQPSFTNGEAHDEAH